jgi:hypothetical protein
LHSGLFTEKLLNLLRANSNNFLVNFFVVYLHAKPSEEVADVLNVAPEVT